MSPLQTARGVFTLCLAPILTFIVSLLALIDMLWVRRSEWQAQQFPRWGRWSWPPLEPCWKQAARWPLRPAWVKAR